MMKNESKTLYIPLYGKALTSCKGVILHDRAAEGIWKKEGFKLKGKSRSKWLAYFMSMRAAVIDRWLFERLKKSPESVVLHIGCGLDARVERVKVLSENWYDIDLPEVIEVRRRYFFENEVYKMLGASAMETEWLSEIPDAEKVFVVMEGISMYLSKEAIKNLFAAVSEKFPNAEIVMDAYTERAVKVSKYKNPIKDVGAGASCGIDDPRIFENEKLRYSGELCMTPDDMINELSGFEKVFFKNMFAGNFAKKLYKIYTYKK